MIKNIEGYCVNNHFFEEIVDCNNPSSVIYIFKQKCPFCNKKIYWAEMKIYQKSGLEDETKKRKLTKEYERLQLFEDKKDLNLEENTRELILKKNKNNKEIYITENGIKTKIYG